MPSREVATQVCLQAQIKDCGIHFFDDYQFEQIWNEPEKYLDILVFQNPKLLRYRNRYAENRAFGIE